MKEIPQLTNNWGAMIKLLDAVLITGFNHVPVLGLSKSSATAITAIINLGSGHGFIDRQVIRITGSTNGWDGDYKVLSVDTNTITVECTELHPVTLNSTATCFTAPLDFEIVHKTPPGSSQPKRAYRSKDPEALGLILLVHDFCVSGAAENGSKFAKVGVVSDMSDIDNITGNQMPNDDKNWGWDGTYHGRAKWYYATPTYNNNYEQMNDTVVPAVNNRAFSIVSDGISVVLLIKGSRLGSLYGIAEFFDIAIQGKNAMLAAAFVNASVSQSQALYAAARAGLNAGVGANISHGGSQNQKGILWYSTLSIRQDTALSRPYAVGYLTESTQVDTSVTSDIYIQTPVIDISNIFRGVIPFVRTQIGNGRNGRYYTESGSIESVSIYNDNYGAMNFGLSLELL